jgi:hypothetical protein
VAQGCWLRSHGTRGAFLWSVCVDSDVVVVFVAVVAVVVAPDVKIADSVIVRVHRYCFDSSSSSSSL